MRKKIPAIFLYFLLILRSGTSSLLSWMQSKQKQTMKSMTSMVLCKDCFKKLFCCTKTSKSIVRKLPNKFILFFKKVFDYLQKNKVCRTSRSEGYILVTRDQGIFWVNFIMLNNPGWIWKCSHPGLMWISFCWRHECLVLWNNHWIWVPILSWSYEQYLCSIVRIDNRT